MKIDIAESFSSAQRSKLECDRDADHIPIRSFHQRDCRADSPTRCQHVVHDEDPRTGSQSGWAHLNSCLTVFKFITFTEDMTRKFSRLANGKYPDPRSNCGGRREYESASFETCDRIKLAHKRSDHLINYGAET